MLRRLHQAGHHAGDGPSEVLGVPIHRRLTPVIRDTDRFTLRHQPCGFDRTETEFLQHRRHGAKLVVTTGGLDLRGDVMQQQVDEWRL